MVHPKSLVTWESRVLNFIVKARLSIARENNNHPTIIDRSELFAAWQTAWLATAFGAALTFAANLELPAMWIYHHWTGLHHSTGRAPSDL